MEKLIEFRNTNFGFNNTNTFNDFNLEIMKNDIVTLIGPSGSGKTTILKMLCHKLPNDSLYFKGKNIKEWPINEIQSKIIVVFDAPFYTNNFKEELTFFLKKIPYLKEESEIRVEEFRNYFNLDNLLSLTVDKLSKEEAYLLKVLRFLIIKPEFIAIDNILSLVSKTHMDKIFEFIKQNQITMLNVTNDLNESLYGNKLFVLENFVLILEGSTMSVLKTDNLLKRLGFSLPLTVDLSIELIHYDVLDKIYKDKKKLVNALWK